MKKNRKFKFSEKEDRFNDNNPNNIIKINTKSSPKKRKNKKEIRIIRDITRRSKSRDELDILYASHCMKINRKYEEILKKNPKKNIEQDRHWDLKRCEKCTDFVNDHLMLLCEICDDGYHIYCLDPALDYIPEEDFCCPKCKAEMPGKRFRQSKVDEMYNINIKIKNKTKKCNHCNREINKCENDETVIEDENDNDSTSTDFKTCAKCQKDFHSQCFNKNKNTTTTTSKNKKKISKIICEACDNKIITQLKTTRISDYFKGQKQKNENNLNLKNKIINDKEEKENGSVISSGISDYSTNNNNYTVKKPKKQESKFKLPKELKEEHRIILEQSLLRALLVKGIDFNDDLCYTDPECPRTMNNSSLEPGMQSITENNKEIYYKFKEKTRKGIYPPLEIVEHEIQGFIVRATDDIPMLTLICEYGGEVTLARKKLFDENDSIMDLLRTPSSSTSLVIYPGKRGNIARFFSGVNNFNQKSTKKKNLDSIRFEIDGEAHVLLYAGRNIKKNDILYYDYNAGGYEGYPTYSFI